MDILIPFQTLPYPIDVERSNWEATQISSSNDEFMLDLMKIINVLLNFYTSTIMLYSIVHFGNVQHKFISTVISLIKHKALRRGLRACTI
ncbi:unnamed protein product [Lathyrus oleraceus]